VPEPAIETEGLTRTFGKRGATAALRGVDLRVHRGELFGLLGPNGAGKTTTVKILTTLLLPTAGRAAVAGCDVVTGTASVRRRIGYVLGGDRGLYDRLSAVDNMRYFADLYGVPWRVQRARIGELLEQTGLGDAARRRVETFSRGMKQRLHIARALVHDPEVLFLDEPANGLDPLGARQLRTLVRGLADAGRTVLLTTHQLTEADELCDRIAVIVGGAVRVEGTPTTLKAATTATRAVHGAAHGVDEDALRAALLGHPAVTSVHVHADGHRQLVTVTARGDAGAAAAVANRMSELGVERPATRDVTLEDAYLSIAHGELR
jgi:ABC-2 type transport system ATP-binding protein